MSEVMYEAFGDSWSDLAEDESGLKRQPDE